MKNLKYILFGLLLIGTNLSYGQDIESENGFKYMKAKYLLETDRFEDAIKELNKIIKSAPTYEDVLILRAEAKLALAAYRGSKKDILDYIATNGVTERAINILARSDYELDNADAALNSLIVATAINASADHYEMIAEIYTEKDEMLKACDAWEKAADLGSREGIKNASKICGKTKFKDLEQNKRPKKHKPNTEPVEEYPEKTQKEEDDDPISVGTRIEDEEPDESYDPNYDDEEDDGPISVGTRIEEEEPNKPETVNSIEVDEDLTLEIYGEGLGDRRILDQPSILIISETDGDVAVDICVNRNGKVESADYNSKESTISKSSLVSLAIRKAKEFWFQRATEKEMCGVIKFKITGS